MDSNLTSLWVNFFSAAGIPSDVAATYALTFAENRIQNDMLLDLNKEYLREMGITRMGDVIAILRHAKHVHESTARDKVLSTTTMATKVPVAAVTGRATITQPSSPASRILEHYTRNSQTQETSPTNSLPLKRKSIESSVDNGDKIKKARLIRFAPKVPQENGAPAESLANKQTVFARLGNSEPEKTLPQNPIASKQIFTRLGLKSNVAKESDMPIQKDALKYEGILKRDPIVKKMYTVTTTSDNVRKIAAGTMRADEAPVSVKDKLAMSATKSVKFSRHVDYKEIESKEELKAKNKNKNFAPKMLPVNFKKKVFASKLTQVFNTPERRLFMPDGVVTDIKSRLGKGKTRDLTITRNVFSRLGV